MNRTEKAAAVGALNETFSGSELVVVTSQSGMTVAEVNDLRGKIREAEAGYKVTKNRLARLALKDTPFEGLADFFKGPTAVAFSRDPVAAAKVVVDFANKNNKLEVVGGGLSGQVLDKASVEALAKLPSLDELRAKLLGLIQAPATKVAGVMQAPAGKLARVIQARADQGEGAA